MEACLKSSVWDVKNPVQGLPCMLFHGVSEATLIADWLLVPGSSQVQAEYLQMSD